MTVINTNDVVREVFGLGQEQHGVLILDPGDEYERFQIGELQSGDYFVSVGNESVRSVIDFIAMLLETVTQEHGTDLSTLPSAFQSTISVQYGFRRISGRGQNRQHMKLNKTDVVALQEQYAQLPKAPHADIYPDYHIERNLVGVMLMSVKAARFSYSREHERQLPKSLEDLRPYLMDEQKKWQNSENPKLRREYSRYGFYQWLKDNAILYFPEPRELEQKYEGSILGYGHSMLKRHGKTSVIYDTRALHYEIVTQKELEKQLQEQETPRPATLSVETLDELGKRFVESASSQNGEAIMKLFITQDELKATVTGANIDATYLSIKQAFEASLQEILPSLGGSKFEKMNMDFCPEPVPVKAGMDFGSGISFAVDTLATDNIRVIADVAGDKREIKLDALIKVGNNWRLFSPIEVLPRS